MKGLNCTLLPYTQSILDNFSIFRVLLLNSGWPSIVLFYLWKIKDVFRFVNKVIHMFFLDLNEYLLASFNNFYFITNFVYFKYFKKKKALRMMFSDNYVKYKVCFNMFLNITVNFYKHCCLQYENFCILFFSLNVSRICIVYIVLK